MTTPWPCIFCRGLWHTLRASGLVFLSATLYGGGVYAAQPPASVTPNIRLTYDPPANDATELQFEKQTQAGVANEHIRLESRGIRGNGHGIPSELNNLVTARMINEWLQGKVR